MKKERSNEKILGYAVGTMAEACIYNYVTSFFVLYLITIVNLSPTIASTILSATILMESIGSMIIGQVSDGIRSKYGRRRPLILIAALATPVSIVCLFIRPNLNLFFTIGYYAVFSTLFWLLYTVFYIPYTALGGELSRDYKDRIIIRTYSRAMGLIGSMVAYIFPNLSFKVLSKLGLSSQRQWLFIAVALGIMTFACYYICFHKTRGCEQTRTDYMEKNKISLVSLVKNFEELIHLKAMRYCVAYKIFFMFGITLYSSSLMIFLRYVVNMKEEIVSLIFIFSTIVSLILTPFIAKRAVDVGKNLQQMESFFISGTIGLAVFFVGNYSYFAVALLIISYSYAQTSFWQLSNALFYDIIEVDEFVYKKHREGDISCIQSVIGTLISSITIQFMGMLLNMSGFDGSLAVQHQGAIDWIKVIFVLLPAIGFIISGLIIKHYPVTKKNYEKLRNCIEMNLDVTSVEDDIKKIL